MKRPNILLITGDHLRNDALACNGNPFVDTPHVDALAARGATFLNAFSPNPICVPGRAAITTGNYPHVCTGNKNNGGRIREGQTTIAGHFAGAGYATLAIGKLHYVPYAPPGQPRLLHGFQRAELCEEGRIVGLFDPQGRQHGLEEYHDFLHDVGWGGYERAHGIGNNDVRAATCALPAEYHEEAWVAQRTIANLREHLDGWPEQPFFCWASFTKPHSPYDPPEPYHRRYDPRELPPPIGSLDLLADRDPLLRSLPTAYGWDKLSPEAVRLSRAYYYGMITFQDAMIGRMLGFLKDAGELENTIILYSADHGDLLGDFGCFFKCNMLQGSVGVPLVVAGPGVPAQAEPLPHLAGLQDILPTVADLAGVPLPRPVHGISQAQALRDPRTRLREVYVSESLESPCQRAMVRTDRWKYVYHELGGVEELYDVVEDRQELHNLARERPAVAAELRGALLDWCREYGDAALLDGAALKRSPEDAAAIRSFEAGRMGWRWY